MHVSLIYFFSPFIWLSRPFVSAVRLRRTADSSNPPALSEEGRQCGRRSPKKSTEARSDSADEFFNILIALCFIQPLKTSSGSGRGNVPGPGREHSVGHGVHCAHCAATHSSSDVAIIDFLRFYREYFTVPLQRNWTCAIIRHFSAAAAL